MRNYLTLERAENIMQLWGYSQLTSLQRKTMDGCQYTSGARELIIGVTSSGKTQIPTVAFQAALQDGESGKLLYLLPYRALAVQKMEELTRYFPDFDIKISTSEYCAADTSVAIGDCDIAIVIYEKAFLFQTHDYMFISRYTHVIFDEIGLVENEERGFKVDYLLKYACSYPANIYLLATPYVDWSGYKEAYHFRENRDITRPVEIKSKAVMVQVDSKNWKHRPQLVKENRYNIIASLCREHLDKGHKILIFLNSRKESRLLAHNLNETLYRNQWNQHFSITEGRGNLLKDVDISVDDLRGVFGNDDDIIAYYNGIAFHNASLPEVVRDRIESDFLLDGGPRELNIVCATETLGFGLNSNVDVVIIAKMSKRAENLTRFLTENEYQNYIGRCGRFGLRSEGYAYTICQNDTELTYWETLDRRAVTTPSVERGLFKNLQSESNQLSDKRMMVLLHFFSFYQEAMTRKQLCREILSIPASHTNISDLPRLVEEAVRQMEKRGLIKKDLENDCEDDISYRITSKGKSILGYIIFSSTYDILVQSAGFLLDERVPYFDFLFELFRCQELAIIRNEIFPAEVCARHWNGLMCFLNKLLATREISFERYEEVMNCPGMTLFAHNGKEFFQKYPGKTPEGVKVRKDFTILLQIWALHDWSHGVDLNTIYRNTELEYSRIQYKGLKLKYILDILLAVKQNEITKENQTRLLLIGVSCYYGVRLDTLRKLAGQGAFPDTSQIEPGDGRQLRILSQILNRKAQVSNEPIRKLLYQGKNLKPVYFYFLKKELYIIQNAEGNDS